MEGRLKWGVHQFSFFFILWEKFLKNPCVGYPLFTVLKGRSGVLIWGVEKSAQNWPPRGGVLEAVLKAFYSTNFKGVSPTNLKALLRPQPPATGWGRCFKGVSLLKLPHSPLQGGVFKGKTLFWGSNLPLQWQGLEAVSRPPASPPGAVSKAVSNTRIQKSGVSDTNSKAFPLQEPREIFVFSEKLQNFTVLNLVETRS